MFQFRVIGPVVAKQSCKIRRLGNIVRPYTPPDIKAYANLVKQSFLNRYPNYKPFTGAVEMIISVKFAIPKSYTEQKRKQIAFGKCFPTKKPDCDNICKQIADALNGIAYLDDKQIVKLTVTKHYGMVDYVDIKIDEYSELVIQRID